VGELLRHYIIELITAMTNTNIKIRSIAQEIFSEISILMRCKFNAVNQLFTIILVGLAGNKPQTQSSTIRSLIFTIKQNVVLNKQLFVDLDAPVEPEADVDFETDEVDQVEDPEKNKIQSNDEGF
jgi:hypothetical protein